MPNLQFYKDLIYSVYQNHSKRRIDFPGFVPSAVLIPLFEKQNEPHILFIKRSLTVRHHKGQISFPGGACDASDRDLLDTALRETDEEIGVSPSSVEMIAELDDIVTPTNFRVTPFAGIIPFPYAFKIDPQETSELIEIPLAHLLNDSHHRLGYRRVFNQTHEVHYYDYKDYTVWGVTGLILHELFQKMKIGSGDGGHDSVKT
jgi:8-oxo-dGTP pyrophosphatase MutT (NUDIX family)